MLRDEVPEGLVALRVREGGVVIDHGDAHPVLPGAALDHELLVDSMLDREVVVEVQGERHVISPSRARLIAVRFDGPVEVRLNGEPVLIEDVVRVAPVARLRLCAGVAARWSVTDPSGQGWFRADGLNKWDFQKRPFFSGDDLVLDVPAGRLHVRVARGLEYEPAETDVDLAPGEERTVELSPRRWIDPAKSGWFGADLHVHMNYGGDFVCSPHDAAVMQLGEGLHLMNLVAGNCVTSRIFDRAALETFAGEDLWSQPDAVARMGVEFRNDLLGHVHALGPSAPPSRYHSGHAGSDEPEDWPPNTVACEELRALGATVGYCHPVVLPLDDDAPAESVFNAIPRTLECRELVADAALGLVDSMDVLSNLDNPAAGVVYRHLLGAGLSFAVTAGTDVFLSFSNCATLSNPPGWARVYAQTGGELSVAAFQEAVRRCATMATNGPWLELAVDGADPGTRLDRALGDRVRVVARVAGPAPCRLAVRTADGVVAESDSGEAVVELTLGESTYVVAVAQGDPHPEVLGAYPFAHTSPVWLDVDGRPVARRRDADWCLDWLDRLEKLAREHGVFSTPEHFDDLADVLDRARAYYCTIR